MQLSPAPAADEVKELWERLSALRSGSSPQAGRAVLERLERLKQRELRRMAYLGVLMDIVGTKEWHEELDPAAPLV